MSADSLKLSVLDPQLCTGCGACGLACPEDVIRFDRQNVLPLLDFDHEICGTCTDCLDVCPGLDTATDASEVRLFGRVRNSDERWLGIMHSYFGMISTDPITYAKSASGGSTTTLLQSSGEFLGVRWFLTMGRNQEEGWLAAPSVTEEPDALASNAQSTYQLAPYLNELRAVFDKYPEDKIAIVGLACHMQAVRKLQVQDTPIGQWAREKIALLIETACSSNTLPSGTAQILTQELDAVPANITDVRFREGPYPGNFQATDKDGRKLDVPFWKILSHLKKNKSFRCLSCGDWMSGLADISVCDGDPNIFDTSVNGNRIEKHCRVIIRTEVGRALVENCVNAGKVDSWPIDFMGFNLGLERKMSRRRHYETTGRQLSIGSSASDEYREEDQVSDDELIDPQRYK